MSRGFGVPSLRGHLQGCSLPRKRSQCGARVASWRSSWGRSGAYRGAAFPLLSLLRTGIYVLIRWVLLPLSLESASSCHS